MHVFIVPFMLGFVAAILMGEGKLGLYSGVAAAAFAASGLRLYVDDIPLDWVEANLISGLATVAAIAAVSVLGAYIQQFSHRPRRFRSMRASVSTVVRAACILLMPCLRS